MVRSDIRENVRHLLRMVNTRPFDDADVNDAIEEAIDDLSNRCPFAMAVDRGSSVRNQREYILPMDILELIEVYYKDEAGTALDGAITAGAPATGGVLTVLDTTDFAETGTVQVGSEQITYTGKNSTHLTGITRGANSTTAAAHDNGATVFETGKQFTVLATRTSRSMATANAAWLADTGTPTEFYTYPAVLGFDRIPTKSGVQNILIRSLIRPPALSADTDTVESLLSSFVRTIGRRAAYSLAVRLASDEASQAQAARWLQDYIQDIVLLKQRQDHYERTSAGGIKPVTRRQ